MEKRISVILIIFIMLFVLIIGQTFANTVNDYEFHSEATINNLETGKEVAVRFYSTKITEDTNNITLALEYSSDILTLDRVVTGENWSQTELLGTYFISTESATPGTIITFYLKVNNDVEPGTRTDIKLTSIELATDDPIPLELDDLSMTITLGTPIVENQDNEITDDEVIDNEVIDNELTDNEIVDNEIVDNEVTDNGITDNEVIDNSITIDNEVVDNEITDNNELTDNEVMDNELIINELPIEKVNEIGGKKTEDNVTQDTVTNKPIPQTGENVPIQISIAGMSILSIISFIIYKKNKIQ